DLPIRRYGQAARQAIARSEPAGIDMHPIRTGRWWRMAAHTHDAEPATLAAPAVGRQLQPVAPQREKYRVTRVGFHGAQPGPIGAEHRQLLASPPAGRNELTQTEAGKEQPDTRQREPQATRTGCDDDRIVEILLPGVV